MRERILWPELSSQIEAFESGGSPACPDKVGLVSRLSWVCSAPPERRKKPDGYDKKNARARNSSTQGPVVLIVVTVIGSIFCGHKFQYLLGIWLLKANFYHGASYAAEGTVVVQGDINDKEIISILFTDHRENNVTVKESF